MSQHGTVVRKKYVTKDSQMERVARIVFFGTPEFALPSLTALVEQPDFQIIQVVTQPDRPAGRGRKVQPPPVKQRALEYQLPVWQPENLRRTEAVEYLRTMEPSIAVVVAYGELIPRRLLTIPRHGFLNVHPSLLPRYRGASPIQAALLNGDEYTGVSIILLNVEMDAGPILAQVTVPINPADTAATLSSRLANTAAQILPHTIRGWIRGSIRPVPQDHSQATYTRPLKKEDGCINWNLSAEQIERMIRAFQPWPLAWTMLKGRRFALLRAQVVLEQPAYRPGCLYPVDGTLLVGTGTVPLKLEVIQPEGKRPMSAIEWWRGARLPVGACFDAR